MNSRILWDGGFEGLWPVGVEFRVQALGKVLGLDIELQSLWYRV